MRSKRENAIFIAVDSQIVRQLGSDFLATAAKISGDSDDEMQRLENDIEELYALGWLQ